MKPKFINVDFEFSSMYEISHIANELKDKIEILANEKMDGKYCLNFECSAVESKGDPSVIINIFFDCIENLSESGKKCIDSCEKKVIDIGYGSGAEGWQYSSLSNSILKKIADGGFQLNISIYGAELSI